MNDQTQDPFAMCEQEGHYWVSRMGPLLPKGVCVVSCSFCPTVYLDGIGSLLRESAAKGWAKGYLARFGDSNPYNDNQTTKDEYYEHDPRATNGWDH